MSRVHPFDENGFFNLLISSIVRCATEGHLQQDYNVNWNKKKMKQMNESWHWQTKLRPLCYRSGRTEKGQRSHQEHHHRHFFFFNSKYDSIKWIVHYGVDKDVISWNGVIRRWVNSNHIFIYSRMLTHKSNLGPSSTV